MTPSSRVINLGDAFVIGIHFATNGASKTFVLQSQPGSVPSSLENDNTTWTALATLTTDAVGNATYTDRPPDSRFYRVSFAGADDLAPGVSLRARALVRQIHLLEPSNHGLIVTIQRGTVIAFTSTVQPARPLLPAATVTFVVYERTAGQWSRIASRDVIIDQAGHASFTFAFSSRGSFYVRSVARPTVVNANSIWTPVNRYDVI